MINNPYIEQITERLQELNPHLIMLFGSYAYGTPSEDSDIDLLVVTNDDFIPANFEEKMNVHLSVSQHIFELSMLVPIDLVVYTLPMYEKFITQNSQFANDITTKGVRLYEKYNKTVA